MESIGLRRLPDEELADPNYAESEFNTIVEVFEVRLDKLVNLAERFRRVETEGEFEVGLVLACDANVDRRSAFQEVNKPDYVEGEVHE